MTQVIKCGLIALALITAPWIAAAAQGKIDISFAIAHVEDRYALNLPVFRDIFRLFDFGYAGCSVELTVTPKGDDIPRDANPKIQVEYTVQLDAETPAFKHKTNGSIARRSVPIYLHNKCAEISDIKIGDVQCFIGFKQQFKHLSCPYNFRINEFSIPDYYDNEP